MALGFSIDVLRSPTGLIVAICSSSSSLFDSLRSHVVVMPAAHAGMLLAPLVLVATDLGNNALNPVGALTRAAGVLVEMLAAEIVVLYLLADGQRPEFMMLAMAGVMGAFACTWSVVKGCSRCTRG